MFLNNFPQKIKNISHRLQDFHRFFNHFNPLICGKKSIIDYKMKPHF